MLKILARLPARAIINYCGVSFEDWKLRCFLYIPTVIKASDFASAFPEKNVITEKMLRNSLTFFDPMSVLVILCDPIYFVQKNTEKTEYKTFGVTVENRTTKKLQKNSKSKIEIGGRNRK